MRVWRRKLRALLITLLFFFLPTATRDAQRGKDTCQSPSRAGHMGFMFKGKRGKWSPKGLEAVLKKLE